MGIKNRLGLILLLLMVAGATRWWLLSLQPDEATEALPEARADYRLIEFDLMALDEQGRRQFRVRAPLLETAPVTGDARAVEPVIDVFPVDGSGWTLVSETADILEDGEKIIFNGETVMESHDPQPTTITTSDLHVLTTPRTAQSSNAVTILEKRSKTSGIGLNAWLESKRFEILSDVTANYQPTK